MKKIFTFPILILPFVLTSCNWSKLIDKFTPKREGVTFAEFRAAAEEADKKPRNYTGFICSGEFPDRDRKSTRLNSSHIATSRMPSSA